MKVYHPLNPIYNSESKIIILGSMPSQKSREEGFYYAHKTNRFWPVMEMIFKVKLNSNKEKERFLLKNNIALWDVIKSCDINNSDDRSIKNVLFNDIDSLLNKTNIKYVFCTGKKAYNLFIKKYGYENIFCLSSPSSANASKNIYDLVKEYEIIKKYL